MTERELASVGSDNSIDLTEGGLRINHVMGHHTHVTGVLGSEHTFETEEAEAFSQLINSLLEGDPFTARHIPLDIKSNEIFEKMGDGLILTRIINIAAPKTVNESVINHQPNMSVYQKNENLNVVIKAITGVKGIHVVNIGSLDISMGRYVHHKTTKREILFLI